MRSVTFFISLNQFFFPALGSLSPGWEVQSQSLLGFSFLLCGTYTNLRLIGCWEERVLPDSLSRLLFLWVISGFCYWEWHDSPRRHPALHICTSVFLLLFQPLRAFQSSSSRARVMHAREAWPFAVIEIPIPSRTIWCPNLPAGLTLSLPPMTALPFSMPSWLLQNNDPPLMGSRNPLLGSPFSECSLRKRCQHRLVFCFIIDLFLQVLVLPRMRQLAAGSKGGDGKWGKGTYSKESLYLLVSWRFQCLLCFSFSHDYLSHFADLRCEFSETPMPNQVRILFPHLQRAYWKE